MYQPKLARFMSRDPVSENGVDILYPIPDMRRYVAEGANKHPYAYGSNDPINRIDPSGQKSCKCHGCDWTFGGASGNLAIVIGYSYARVTARCSKAELRAYRHYDCGGFKFRKPIHCYCEAKMSFHIPSCGIQVGGNWIAIFGGFTACADAEIAGGPGWSAEITLICVGAEGGGDFSGDEEGDYGGGGLCLGGGGGLNVNWNFINVRSSGLQCVREPLNTHEKKIVDQFGRCTSKDVRITPPKVVDNPYSIRPPGEAAETE